MYKRYYLILSIYKGTLKNMKKYFGILLVNNWYIKKTNFLFYQYLIDLIRIKAWEDVPHHNDIPQTNRQHPITQYIGTGYSIQSQK